MTALFLDVREAQRVRTAKDDLKILADQQLSHWRSQKFAPTRSDFERLNREIPHLSVFEIENGLVRCWEKSQPLEKIFQFRSDQYQAFLQSVLIERRCNIKTVLAYVLNDRFAFKESIPLFGYQKRNFDTTILLPDIEFLQYDFYQSNIYVDTSPFEAKQAKGFFVGGTSGAGIISKKKVLEKQVPRINAALYFKDKSEVDFFIAKIGQVDGEETRQSIMNLGLDGPRPLKWQDHYDYKFHISMDGNGATCSRLVLSLKSNSALIKYSSEWGLFFFPLMSAGKHYLEVRSDADVVSLVSLERRHPGYWSHVAENGRQFYTKYLTRDRLLDYSAFVLEAYAETYEGSF